MRCILSSVQNLKPTLVTVSAPPPSQSQFMLHILLRCIRLETQHRPQCVAEKLLGQECLQRKLVMSPGLQPEQVEVPLWRQSK